MAKLTKEDYENTVKVVGEVGRTEAARILGITPRTLRERLSLARTLHGLSVVPTPPAETPEDPVEVQERRDTVRELRSELTRANRQISRLRDLRSTAFELIGDGVQVPSWTVPEEKRGDSLKEIAMLFTSDFQAAEVVKSDEMDGWNEYNSEIFVESYRSMIGTTIKLCLDHTAHPDYHGIVYMRGGDALSGEIHDLKETNDLDVIPAIKLVAAEEIRGIELLLKEFPRVHVVSIPGNHGRTTIKPKSKAYADNNYEDLISWYIEGHFTGQGEERVTFHTPRSGDAFFPVGCLRFLLTHGDRIGARGGQGFIGPLSPISKGVKKILEQYHSYGRHLDYVMIGHFHQAMEIFNCFVNGSMVGYNQYARDLRLRPEPPCQWLLNIHPETGIITNQRKIWVRNFPKEAVAVLPWEV